MKVTIRDKEALAALSWVDLKAYLDSTRWRHVDDWVGKAAIYHSPDQDGRPAEILVPLRDDFADYAARMGDAVATLARVEDRSEESVYSDLVESGADVVRLRSPGADDEGTISIVDGVALYRGIEELMLAAACSATESRLSYHARKVSEAREFLKGVRLGQTEHGSYVIAVHSPVAPTLRHEDDLSLAVATEGEPFSRVVMLKLAEGLQAVTEAVGTAVAQRRFEALEDAVSRGVSANLCDALANLAEHGSGLDVSISWARIRPTAGAPRQFHFSPKIAPTLREAAGEFRRREPRLGERIEGFVVRLNRLPDQIDGQATLRALIDGKTRNIGATFDEDEYRLIVKAHQSRLIVSMDGDVYQRGARWEVRNPRNLRLLDDAAEDEE